MSALESRSDAARSLRREQVARRLERMAAMAPHSLEAHARLIHRDDRGRPLQAARHHKEWVRILEDREQYPFIVLVAPPATAKCLAEDTRVTLWDGKRRRIRDLEIGDEVVSMDYGMRHFRDRVVQKWDSGGKRVRLLVTEGRRKIKMSDDHRMLTRDGWTEARLIRPGDQLVNVRQSRWEMDRVVEIHDVGEEQTYDIETARCHNFVANGLLSHNSTWVSIIYATWRIGATGGSTRIGLISNTATQAQNMAGAIASATQSHWFQQSYPDTLPDFDRGWTKSQLHFLGTPEGPNPTLMAAGVGSNFIQGRRFDEIILDDPTNFDEARSDVIMMTQRTWLKSLLIPRLPLGTRPPDGKGGRVVVVLTRWGERDLVPTLQDELGFKVVRMPALGYWDRIETVDGDVIYGEEPLWPEMETRESLLREREEDPITFEMVKQGNPNAMGGDIFDPKNFQRGKMPPRETFDNVVQYADTAGGKDRLKGDYFALATVGVRNEGREVWIMNMRRDRWAAPEQERVVMQEAERWSPDLVCIEDKNEGIALYQNLITSTRLPLKPINPERDKEWRAIPLSNAYRARRVFHPNDWYEAPDGTMVDPKWVRIYENELEAFPTGRFDDQVDSASGAYRESASPGPRVRVLS